MAALKRLTHRVDVADTFETVIRPAAGQLHQMADDIAFYLFRIDEMRHAEPPGKALARRIEIDTDDHVGTGQLRALNDIEADAAETEDHDIGAGLHARREDDGTDACGNAAADVANFIKRCVLPHLRQRDFRQYRVIREGRAAHIVEHGLALIGKTAGTVRHHALALRRANGGAQIGLVARTAFAFAAFGRVERDHMIAGGERFDAGPDLDDDTRPLMTQDRREGTFRVIARQRERIRVADAGGLHLDQDFALFRSVELHRLYFKPLARLECHCRTHVHICSFSTCWRGSLLRRRHVLACGTSLIVRR